MTTPVALMLGVLLQTRYVEDRLEEDIIPAVTWVCEPRGNPGGRLPAATYEGGRIICGRDIWTPAACRGGTAPTR